MDPIIKNLFTIGGIAAAICGGSIWYLKHWIADRIQHDSKTQLAALQNKMDLELQAHRIRLEAKSEGELDKLRASLQIAAAERHVQFSQIFERQAKVIGEIYSKLQDLYAAADRFISSVTEETNSALLASFESFAGSFEPQRLYLPKASATQIDAIVLKCRKAIHKARMYDIQQRAGVPLVPANIEAAWDFLEEFPKLLLQVEDDFRSVLRTHEKV
jgi:hypothetical protein